MYSPPPFPVQRNQRPTHREASWHWRGQTLSCRQPREENLPSLSGYRWQLERGQYTGESVWFCVTPMVRNTLSERVLVSNWQKSPRNRVTLFLLHKNSSFPSENWSFYTSVFTLAPQFYVGSTFPSANIFYKLRLCLFSDQKLNFSPPQHLLTSDPEGHLSNGPCSQRWRESLWWLQSTFAVYLLFIVLTATLRTDSSWVSRPSITEPNSPEGRHENTKFRCSFIERYRLLDYEVITLHAGSKHISVRQKWWEISGKQALVPMVDKPRLCCTSVCKCFPSTCCTDCTF